MFDKINFFSSFQNQKFSYIFLNHSLLTTVTLSLSLFLIPAAIAGFAPKNRTPASDYTRSAGRRGCPGERIPLTLLAPQTYVAYTASSRPTFVGFVSSPQTVNFRIFELIPDQKPQQLGAAINQDVQPGIFQISLPKNTADLTVGKKYFWQLSIKCRGIDVRQAAEFVVIEMPSTVKSKLPNISDHLAKATIYAKADLWYEALAEALKTANNGKLGEFASTLIKNFAEYESPRPREQEIIVKRRVENLQTIAIQERDEKESDRH